ncbi:HAMP domain-containing histidine kinase [Streptomyces sp. HNM0575]|nr:HAMP domain-containing sensor histidine kinase [Streptomyces sp. HNM0575]NLU74867.1 HAMP domain-containing histidine kinase [Streptomyces sp. HNM0575]
MVLRDGLAGNARLKAESAAREVAAQVSDVPARDVRNVEGLEKNEPVQVVGPKGQVLGADETLRGRGPVADFNRPEADASGRTGTGTRDGSAAQAGTGTGIHVMAVAQTGTPTGNGTRTGTETGVRAGHGSDEAEDGGGHGGSGGPGSGDDGDDDSGRGGADDKGADDKGADDKGDDGPGEDGPGDDGTREPDGGESDEPDESDEPSKVDRDVEERTVRLPVDEDSARTEDFTVVAVQSVTRDGVPVTVYAGASLRDQQEAVSSVTQAMLIGLPALLVVVGGVTWLVTRRALRPVESIRGEMAGIMASADLSRRVPEPHARDEVARLARTTNDTLAALESSVERQRRFVADVSHELRSPIASLRTQLEVGAAHPDLLDVDGAVQDTVRLQQLATDLLLLARLDAGERPGEGRVSLGALVREELAQQQDPSAHPVRLGTMADGEVTGSRAQLARVVVNLLQNAQRHAATEVRASVREVRQDGRPWVELEVDDDGPGVPEAERERIFERFVRLDDARSRDEGGAGLGLAIARDVAERHGGTLTVPAGSRFVLRLPAARKGAGKGTGSGPADTMGDGQADALRDDQGDGPEDGPGSERGDEQGDGRDGGRGTG